MKLIKHNKEYQKRERNEIQKAAPQLALQKYHRMLNKEKTISRYLHYKLIAN